MFTTVPTCKPGSVSNTRLQFKKKHADDLDLQSKLHGPQVKPQDRNPRVPVLGIPKSKKRFCILRTYMEPAKSHDFLFFAQVQNTPRLRTEFTWKQQNQLWINTKVPTCTRLQHVLQLRRLSIRPHSSVERQNPQHRARPVERRPTIQNFFRIT